MSLFFKGDVPGCPPLGRACLFLSLYTSTQDELVSTCMLDHSNVNAYSYIAVTRRGSKTTSLHVYPSFYPHCHQHNYNQTLASLRTKPLLMQRIAVTSCLAIILLLLIGFFFFFLYNNSVNIYCNGTFYFGHLRTKKGF